MSKGKAKTQGLGHITVLRDTVLAYLPHCPGGWYLDATLGAGGHSEAILDTIVESQVWGIDQDPWAIETARQRLASYGDRFHYWRGSFQDFVPPQVSFQGIVADLGVSSHQLDQGERGFSFRQDAPLDMRMNPDTALTAAAIVNHWSEADLVQLFSDYGEERFSRRIAHAIVQQRPLHTTWQLADTIRHAIPAAARQGRLHPATRVFQALRIAVNQELTALEQFLQRAPSWLAPGGHLAVISFHRLEDRRVKQALRGNGDLEMVTKKPLVPTPEEVRQNPRSRSAKLRV